MENELKDIEEKKETLERIKKLSENLELEPRCDIRFTSDYKPIFIKALDGVLCNLSLVTEFGSDVLGIYCSIGDYKYYFYYFKPGDCQEALYNNFIRSLQVNILKPTVK